MKITIEFGSLEEFQKHINLVNTTVPQIDIAAPVECLGLTVRTINCLKEADINTIRDLISMSTIDLLKLPLMGKKSTTEIKDALATFGLALIA